MMITVEVCALLVFLAFLFGWFLGMTKTFIYENRVLNRGREKRIGDNEINTLIGHQS